MTINKVHCLFEQSGTFKNEFKKFGISAEDYDILNDFGETDHVIDLFNEIRGGYEGKPSIFDTFQKDDVIFAFFPCIRFEASILLWFRGQAKQMKSWTDVQKMQYCMKLQSELTELYNLVNMLFQICIKRELRLIMENPYSEEHYLRRYWCIPPAIIDKDRRERGDYYKKPTQYWFINIKPKNNLMFETVNDNSINIKDTIRNITKDTFEKHTGRKITSGKVARSMIHPNYANRFIREFIL